MIRNFAGIPLHSTVEAALRSAAALRVRGPVDTHTLLVELMRADTSGDWSRICLNTGSIDAIADKLVIDPPKHGAWYWERVPLTDSCALALDVAWRLAHRYALLPIPLGLVVIGLVADDSAASRALRDGMAPGELLTLLQTDVLGTTLSGLDGMIITVLSEARAVQRQRSASLARPTPAAFGSAAAPPLSTRRKVVTTAVVTAFLAALGWAIFIYEEPSKSPKVPSPPKTFAPTSYTWKPPPSLTFNPAPR
ncbi:hypothetical protein ABZ319_39315 [Nocardia sp. NPDC005978]|uniref:hypothetical protein n=1 Tax=Nocardia sp. NPDC005978 TaxID=3156725 RepID=UPI0033A31700